MQNVLFVVDEMKYGGVSSALIETLRRLETKFSIDLLILHPHGEMLDKLPANVKPIFGSSFFNTVDASFTALRKNGDIGGMMQKAFMALSLKSGSILFLVRRQRQRLLKKKYDVEIAYKDGFCTVFTYAGDTPRRLAWVHNDYGVFTGSDRYIRLMKRAFSSMDGIAAVSKRAGDALCRKFGLEKLPRVIPNPVDGERIIKLSLQPVPAYPADTFNFVSVGRLCGQKGYDRLLRVHIRLLREGYNHRIYLIGSGEDAEKLRSEIEKYDAGDSFVLLGYRENPYPYIRNADFYVMSSRHEASPVAITEALILKTPVISTDVADVAERLEQGRYGIVTENSEEALFSGMKSILSDRSIAQQYKANLSSYVCDEAETIRKIEQFIKEGGFIITNDKADAQRKQN